MLLFSALPTAHAQTFNASDDYSTTNNPNGVWSAGFKESLTSTLTLYDVTFDAGASHGWLSSVLNNSNAPAFFKSFTTADGGQIPGFVHLHGGAGGQLSVLRFTAPTAGDYAVSAEWFAGDSGETSAHIVQDNVTELFTDSATSDGAVFDGIVTLTQGGFLDVGVGTAGDFFNDTTPFTLNITGASTAVAPEPGTLALIGLVGVPLAFGVARRRK